MLNVFFNLLREKAGLFVLFFGLLSITACGQETEQEQGQHQTPPTEVTVLAAQKSDVEIFRTYPARVHGSRQVQVRSRVQGILEKKMYQEGSAVEKNDILFIIDPKPFEIALRRAEAELRDAQATRDHAQREKQRYSRLYEQNAVSQRERDQVVTDFELAQARVSMAETALDEARLNLSYTEVRSPVAGITGIKDVSEGNLIDWGGLLTTISQNDPVHVHFSIPENDAFVRRTTGNTGSGLTDKNTFEAHIIFPHGETYSKKGNIDFTASTIDPATGTVTARAIFPNPEHMLLPGQFLRIKVLLQQLEDIIIIPEQAIGQGPDGPSVFIVEDNTAASRNLTLGPVVNQGRVVLEGLAAEDLVVINGHVALRPGMPVRMNNQDTEDNN